MSNSTLNLILASDQPSLFATLLKKDDIDYKELLYYLLRNSSTKAAKDTATVKHVYAKLKFNKTDKKNLLMEASEFDFIELVRLILNEMKNYGNIKRLLRDVFITASDFGSIEVLKLMLADTRVDPSYNSNFIIQTASLNGRSEAVKLLLTDPRVDPSDGDNWAIQEALENDYTEVVKILLADPRVDPSFDNNWVIRRSSQYGHTDVVKMLLGDTRVDPSAKDNFAIKQAYHNYYPAVAKLLSLHPKLAHPKKLDIEILLIIVEEWLSDK